MTAILDRGWFYFDFFSGFEPSPVLLGLPTHIRVMGLMLMGYPAEDATPLDLHFQYRDMDDMVEEI